MCILVPVNHFTGTNNFLQIFYPALLYFFRIYKKTISCPVDGARNYEKSFRLFAAPRIDETNDTTVAEIRAELRNRPEDFEEIESGVQESVDKLGLEDVDIELLSLSDIWNDNDLTLPRRIRCAVHLLALTGTPDFGSRRQKDFWDAHDHKEYKSK